MYLLKTAPMGTRVQLWDAWHLTSIVTVDVPVLNLADAPQARAQQPKFAAGLGKMKRWFDAGTNASPIQELRGSAALKTPEWLELISRQPAAGGRSVLLLGSPLYLNPTEPTFSMTEARYPADGHLRATLNDSVFGLAGKTNRLAGTTVHWCYFSEGVWQTELHRTVVTRFWGLFTQEQKGSLATFGADLPTVLANSVRIGLPACGQFVFNAESDKLEMRTAAPRSVPLAVKTIRAEAPVSPVPRPVAVKTVTEIVPPPSVQVSPVRGVPVAAIVQTPPQPNPIVKKEVAKPSPVILDVTVVDRNNSPIANLERTDFTVYEDGVKQEITSFTRDRTPISIGLLIDTSGSIAGKLSRIEAAATSIIRQSQPGDEFFVMEFKADATVVQDFTTNATAIEYCLGHLSAGGQTALLDAVKNAIEHANKWAKHNRKCVVVVTDGDERDSRCSREQLLQSLRVAKVQLYAVGFPDGLNAMENMPERGSIQTQSQKPETKARTLLDELTRVSGGRPFYPRQVGELDGIAGSIARELRTQYRLAYYPTQIDRDGRWREVRVSVGPSQEREGLIARTRAGYFAPASP
jgi:Ca-activated chloride channel family protein